ncbi:ABC transporter substrate-binding protein [Paenibacillaceae bacterium WGS1546]|uniref:ABC transporter substrate-binding protein n=1 Tax=Cohnella sp. WGS1546 TaxID=3366810 RepID=UPI00372D4B01
MIRIRILAIATAAMLAIAGATILWLNGQQRQQSGAIDEQPTRSIVFANWVSTEDAARQMINRVIEDFEKDHPGVAIVNMPIPFDYYEQELTALSLSGKAPNVIQLSGNNTAVLVALGVLEPLEAYALRGDYLLDQFNDTIVDAGKYGDKLYAVPFALTPHGFWYNKSLMKQAGLDPNRPPRTIEELNRHLRIVKEKLPDAYGIGIDTTMANYAFFSNFPFFQAFGAGDILANLPDPKFDTPEMRQTLGWLQEITREGYTPVNKQFRVQRELMAHGKIVYRVDGPYFSGIAKSYNSNLTDELFDETFGVTVIPSMDGERHYTATDIHNLGMSTQTPDKELAWEFIQYLTRGESSIRNYIVPLGMIPAHPSSQEQFEHLLRRPYMRSYLREVIPSAQLMPFGPKMSQATQYILTGIQEVVRGVSPGIISRAVNDALVKLYEDD